MGILPPPFEINRTIRLYSIGWLINETFKKEKITGAIKLFL